MDPLDHKEALRRQFETQARLHEETRKYRHSENVVPMLELAAPVSEDRLLDVACGWGFVALQFAPRVQSAVGVDLTPAMIDLAKAEAARRRVSNVQYVEGDAENLRFQAESFEIVTCRLTFHHFGDAAKSLREMKRVLTPGGRIVLYDFLAPADEGKATSLNEIELARDPSHVKTYRHVEFKELFKQCGLVEKGRITSMFRRHFDHWMAFVGPDDDRKKKVRALIEATIEDNGAGLGARIREGVLTFTHTGVAWLLQPERLENSKSETRNPK